MTHHGWHITQTRRGYRATRGGIKLRSVSYRRLLQKLDDREYAAYLRGTVPAPRG
jgi:hypothetical protein